MRSSPHTELAASPFRTVGDVFSAELNAERKQPFDMRSVMRAVGDADSFEVLGIVNCGKGEPNQAVFVGHAAPACVFRDIAVFSAAK